MNHLVRETSPYLLQHAKNPVDWYPWNDEAFAKARTEDKPIFLSIGYAACHWCHVMEKDSFEKDDVAALLNEHFIAIKVDREERPDIDAIYMRSVQLLNQRGGWPLSVVLTPLGHPFWGATFVPHLSLIQILEKVVGLWHGQRDQIDKSAAELCHNLRSFSEDSRATDLTADISHLHYYGQQVLMDYDSGWGGFGNAPKFPPPITLMALMRCYSRFKDERILEAVKGTFNGMARGGIHDQVGGGFHRYATDAGWLLPHFEKMLYDNALLSYGYLEAFQVTGSAEYRYVATTTLDYIIRDMQDPAGGYYSAEDADSEGCEGRFYLWTYDELKATLKKSEWATLQGVFKVAKEGNFPRDQQVSESWAVPPIAEISPPNILHQRGASHLMTEEDPEYRALIEKLRLVRELKVRPARDDKVITAWNGLMIGAMAKAYQVLGDRSYLDSAQQAAQFVWQNMYHEGFLYRSHCQNERRYRGYLEDYACLIFGFIELYEASLEARWLEAAVTLQNRQDQLFWDEREGGYFSTDGMDQTLLIRTKEWFDSVTPSGNNLSAWNLLRLATPAAAPKMEAQAETIFSYTVDLLHRYPSAMSMLIIALDLVNSPRFQLFIAAEHDKTPSFSAMWANFMPHVMIFGVNAECAALFPHFAKKYGSEGAPRFYLCDKECCHLPTENFTEIVAVMTNKLPTGNPQHYPVDQIE